MSHSKRSTKYIVVQHGMPRTADEMPPAYSELTRLDILRRVWELEHVFDATSHYCYVVENPPECSAFARFLAYTIYNPKIPVHSQWSRVGEYSRDALIAAVEKGLETDDDIIQQWFGADDILKLLNGAHSWDDTLLAVEAIGGSHELYSEVKEYVERVLGKQA